MSSVLKKADKLNLSLSLTFLLSFFNSFFLKLFVACILSVIYVREDNNFDV